MKEGGGVFIEKGFPPPISFYRKKEEKMKVILYEIPDDMGEIEIPSVTKNIRDKCNTELEAIALAATTPGGWCYYKFGEKYFEQVMFMTTCQKRRKILWKYDGEVLEGIPL